MTTLKTQPSTGTYYPPKIMLDGQWRYMVGVSEWHDHEYDAQRAHLLLDALTTLEVQGTPILEGWVSVPACEWDNAMSVLTQRVAK